MHCPTRCGKRSVSIQVEVFMFWQRNIAFSWLWYILPNVIEKKKLEMLIRCCEQLNLFLIFVLQSVKKSSLIFCVE